MSAESKNKLQAVLKFINDYNAEYGYSPTVREPEYVNLKD